MADPNSSGTSQTLPATRTRSSVSLGPRKRIGSKQHIVGHSARLRNNSSRNLLKLSSNTSLGIQESSSDLSAQKSALSSVSLSSQQSDKTQRFNKPFRKAVLSIGNDDEENDEDDEDEDYIDDKEEDTEITRKDSIKNDTISTTSHQPVVPSPLRNGQQVASPLQQGISKPIQRPREISSPKHIVSDDESEDDTKNEVDSRLPDSMEKTSNAHKQEPQKEQELQQQTELDHNSTFLGSSTFLYDQPPPPQISNETVVAVAGNGSNIVDSLVSDPDNQRPSSVSSLSSRNLGNTTPTRVVSSGSDSGALPDAVNAMKSLPLGLSLSKTPTITSHFLDDDNWTYINKQPGDAVVQQNEHDSTPSPISFSEMSLINGMKSLQLNPNIPESRTQHKLWRMRESVLAESSSNHLHQAVLDRTTIEQWREQERISKELHNVRRYVSPLYDSIRRVRLRMGEKVPPDWNTIANQQRASIPTAQTKQNANFKYQGLASSSLKSRPTHARTASVDSELFRFRANENGGVTRSNGSIYNTIAGQRAPKPKRSTSSVSELSTSLPKHPLVMSATTLADLLGESTFNNNHTPSTHTTELSSQTNSAQLSGESKTGDISYNQGSEDGAKLTKSVSANALSSNIRPTTTEGIQKVSTATWTSTDEKIPQLIGTIVRNTNILQALLKRLWTQPFYDPSDVQVDGDSKGANSATNAEGNKGAMLSPQTQGQGPGNQQVSPSILAQAQQAQHKMMLARQTALQEQQKLRKQGADVLSKENGNPAQLQNQAQKQQPQPQQLQSQTQIQREFQRQQDQVAQAQARRAQHYQLQQQQIQEAQQFQQQIQRQQHVQQRPSQQDQPRQHERMRPSQPGSTIQLNNPL